MTENLPILLLKVSAYDENEEEEELNRSASILLEYQ